MAIKSEYNKMQPYSTKDGSQIKELTHPEVHGNKNQSLAEACIPRIQSTGKGTFKILCYCSPPYSAKDTELLWSS